MKEWKTDIVNRITAAAEDQKIISLHRVAVDAGYKHIGSQDCRDIMNDVLKKLPDYKPVQLITERQAANPATAALFTTLNFIQNDIEFDDDEDVNITMTDKQFHNAVLEIPNYTDREAFISDLALSSMFYDSFPVPDDGSIDQQLVDELGHIWDIVHMSLKDLRAVTGLSQVAFAERFCVGRRTVENWESRSCPIYIRLMIAEILGILKR